MSVLTLILAGGAGSRLSILGEKRAKPAVPFAGKYRIIDSGTVIDCCVLNKEIKVGVGTQVGAGDEMTPNQMEPANINTTSRSSESALWFPQEPVSGGTAASMPIPHPGIMTNFKSLVVQPSASVMAQINQGIKRDGLLDPPG